MREIKFRAWDGEEMISTEIFFISVNGYRYFADCQSELWGEYTLKKVEDIKIMQYTGLKDKNGVEIYEGDIVRHSKVSDDISIIRFGEFGVPNFEEQGYQDLAIGFYFENASKLKNIEPFNMTIPLNKDYVKK